MNTNQLYALYKRIVRNKPLSLREFKGVKKEKISLAKNIFMKVEENNLVKVIYTTGNFTTYKNEMKIEIVKNIVKEEAKNLQLSLFIYNGENKIITGRNNWKFLEPTNEKAKKLKKLMVESGVKLEPGYFKNQFVVRFKYFPQKVISWNLNKDYYIMGNEKFEKIEDLVKKIQDMKNVDKKLKKMKKHIVKKAKEIDERFKENDYGFTYNDEYVFYSVDCIEKEGKFFYTGSIGRESEVSAHTVKELTEKMIKQIQPTYQKIRIKSIFKNPI